jgi:hypothetical protein
MGMGMGMRGAAVPRCLRRRRHASCRHFRGARLSLTGDVPGLRRLGWTFTSQSTVIYIIHLVSIAHSSPYFHPQAPQTTRATSGLITMSARLRLANRVSSLHVPSVPLRRR